MVKSCICISKSLKKQSDVLLRIPCGSRILLKRTHDTKADWFPRNASNKIKQTIANRRLSRTPLTESKTRISNRKSNFECIGTERAV